ncbi:MAG: hypothetical protein HC847_16325 [Hydrococcus sp. RU_2_2]|nr:hypothetical protein [Hydrococcus sp. RU_2_2]NJP21579.1 hypothetical protein [Hydrococcus sp. CRU_1_1]
MAIIQTVFSKFIFKNFTCSDFVPSLSRSLEYTDCMTQLIGAIAQSKSNSLERRSLFCCYSY